MNKNTVIIDQFELDVQLPDGSMVSVNDLSYDDLQITLIHLKEAVSNINTQIAEAKADAWRYETYADPDWYRSANDALTIKKRQVELLQATLGKRKRTRALAIDSCFVELCKERIEADAYWEMMKEAQSMYEERVA